MTDTKNEWEAKTVPITEIAQKLTAIEKKIKEAENIGKTVPYSWRNEKEELEKNYDYAMKQAVQN